MSSGFGFAPPTHQEVERRKDELHPPTQGPHLAGFFNEAGMEMMDMHHLRKPGAKNLAEEFLKQLRKL